MPIFDYRCRACGKTFETLVRPQDVSLPQCPSCASVDLEKLLSIPAVTSPEKIQAAADKKRHKEAKVAHRDQIAMDIEAEHHRLEDH